jgi:nicotinamidase-related amidase
MPLEFGALGDSAVHLCVDMQRLFAEDTEWRTPWMQRVLPAVVALVEKRPERTVFTRFIPQNEPGEGHGTWKRYYERWPAMTRSRLAEGMVDLVAPLDRFAPPALVVDKLVYSPWLQTDLHSRLRGKGVDTLVISGGETEVCVAATVLGAIDFGYRVVLAHDALCSSADETHDAMLTIYQNRFGMQVEPVTVAEILDAWR